MQVKSTEFRDLFIFEPEVFSDRRGYFFEAFNKKKFERETGLDVYFVQDNQSLSVHGIVRGLHFQTGNYAQAKLVRVISGEVLDVVVDLRKNEPTFGKHFSIVLSGENKKQLFVPRGFAHGFSTLSKEAVFLYKCDNYYDKKSEQGIIFNDTALHIDWGLDQDKIIVSEKDLRLPSFNEINNNLF